MTPDSFAALIKLEHNIFSEELLMLEFAHIRRYVLAPKERKILGMLVQGMTVADICRLMKTKQGGMQSVKTIKRVIYEIKRKFRTGQRERIDNHPLLRAAKQRRGGK